AREKVNFEVSRILREHFETKRVIVMGATKEGIEALDAMGVEVVNIFSATATEIRNKLEQTSRAAHAVGLGKDEILEVEVHPNSRLANRMLRNLTPVSWKIGLIYRDENIVIPRFDTVLKPKDKVIILGDPAVLKTVAEILTFKFERFPLEYGSTAIAYLSGNEEEEFFSEVDYLFSILPLDRIIFILSKKAAARVDSYGQYMKKCNIRKAETRESILSPSQAISDVADELKGAQGLIIIPRSMLFNPMRPFIFDTARKSFIRNLLQEALCPVFLAGGTFPYEKAAVPCIEEINLQHSLETSLELVSALNNEVTALLVKPSRYISGDEDVITYNEMKKTINDMSMMYKICIMSKVLDGNPVRSITGALADFNIFIADIGGWKGRSWLTQVISPDVVWHILKKTSISTLLLPHVEEAL
ncbi:MAG: hypothetical protein OEU95_09230, partial [Nitrospirota bacterium]|nr:hypothetical protein [Nitrospirota bacterium]